MKIFGVHVSLEVVLLCLIIGAILGMLGLSSLASGKKKAAVKKIDTKKKTIKKQINYKNKTS